MTNDETIAFIQRQPRRKYTKGEVLIQQGNQPVEVYAIRTGYIKISDVSVDGFEQTLWLAQKYDLVPLEWLFGVDDMSPFYYTAHTDIEVYVISRDVFIEHIQQNPTALMTINQTLARKQRQLLHRISATLKPKAREKIIHILHYTAQRSVLRRRDELFGVTLRMTHQDIANMVGITRETASLELKQLREGGYIDYGKQSIRVNAEKLATLVDSL